MAEFSQQEMPLEGSYIAPLMSIFRVPTLDGKNIWMLVELDCSIDWEIKWYINWIEYLLEIRT